jgi:large subunit ribosomal protein L28
MPERDKIKKFSLMAKVCAITGKKPLVGNNVSHSNRKTKRRQMPNLQKKTVINPATGKAMKVLVTGRALRTLNKWLAEGKKVDLRSFVA